MKIYTKLDITFFIELQYSLALFEIFFNWISKIPKKYFSDEKFVFKEIQEMILISEILKIKSYFKLCMGISYILQHD